MPDIISMNHTDTHESSGMSLQYVRQRKRSLWVEESWQKGVAVGDSGEVVGVWSEECGLYLNAKVGL
mgnify:CR=1 FL=1